VKRATMRAQRELKMRFGVGLFVALLGLVAPAARAEHRQAGSSLPQARVIVQARDLQAAEAAVASVGGVVTHRLAIINGVGASLDAVQIDRLRRGPALVNVFADRALGLSGEPGRPSAAAALVGADQLHAAGITGRGVTIAFLDTGYAPSEGLSTDTLNASRIVAGYDAIKDVAGLTAVQDDNGHGSHVMSVAVSSNYTQDILSNARSYNGIAPDAKVVVVKAFDDNGWGSYAGVIRGIEWVVANKDTYGIRVLNCSFGAPPRSHYWQDPLNQAIMRAWQAGIVVVVSAGNTGPGAQTIRAPGNVPYVITVGAMTDSYTPTLAADDRLASFSSTGPTYDRFVKPDFVAPGGHMIGLMDKKAILPREHKNFLDKLNNKYFTMSGTSQSAAVVSGAVALLLQQNAQLSADDVKCRLQSTARAASGLGTTQHAYSVFQQGTGLISVPAASASTAVGCANVGLNVTADLNGEQHFMGRAKQLADGTFTIEGLTVQGSVWDGQLQIMGGVFLNGDPWTDVVIGLQGDPWTDTFGWPGGYPWENHTWSLALEETMSINVWVQQQ
jgi:serine protease AprX